MNKTIQTIMAAIITAATFSVFSCAEVEEPIDTLVTEFVLANTDSKGTISVITNDRGYRYMVMNDTNKLVPDTVYRIVCNYALSEQQTAKILAAYYVYADTAKDVSTYLPGELVNDPISIQSLYVGGGYLNIYMGLKSDGKTKHAINSIRYDDRGSLTLGVYHNANGDTKGTTRYGFMSIPLKKYNLHKGDTVFFQYNNGSSNKKLYSIY